MKMVKAIYSGKRVSMESGKVYLTFSLRLDFCSYISERREKGERESNIHASISPPPTLMPFVLPFYLYKLIQFSSKKQFFFEKSRRAGKE